MALIAALSAAGGGGYWWWKRQRNLDLGAMTIRELPGPDDISDGVLSADGSRVAFVRSRQGQWSLWEAPLENLEQAREIAAWSPGLCYGVAYGPGVGSLYTTVNHDGITLWEYRLGGGPPRSLVTGVGSEASFHPGGRRMAYLKWRVPPRRDIVTADIDGSDERIVFQGTAANGPGQPFWTRDGAALAFPVTVASGPKRETRLWEIPADGGEPRDLLPAGENPLGNPVLVRDRIVAYVALNPESAKAQIRSARIGGEPQWVSRDLNFYSRLHPDHDGGKLLALARIENCEIWQAELAAGAAPAPGASWSRRLLKSGNCGPSRPALLPDGRILYIGYDQQRTDIYALDPRTGDSHILTRGPGLKFDPAITPDGRYIFYVRMLEGSTSIWRMESSGANPTQFSSGPYDRTPRPGADRMLYYVSYTDGGNSAGVMRMPAEGGAAELFQAASDQPPVFSGDGKLAAFFEHDPLVKQSMISIRSVPDSKQRLTLVNQQFSNVTFSPDGAALLYTAFGETGNELWMLPLGGGRPGLLLTLSPERFVQTRFSADGRTLLYLTLRNSSRLVLFEGLR